MKDIFVILDNIRSALNVGAIFRTCEGLGVKKIFLTGITPYPPHKKLQKTALGATEWVEWEYFKQNEDCINKLQSLNIPIITAEITKNSVPFHKFKYPDKLGIVFGHEITGVSLSFLTNSLGTVHIPMQGQKESLNVATSAGIIISHIIFCS
ncbi:MAG: RNA methyltransferase [Candidatus Dojkabacteria bacterium]|nr:MAG: RNA methyltransferase [Candidatus Dojkabacteria bacterium]